MLRLARPRAFLFDLDGTLIDALPDLAAAVRRTLADIGEPARSNDEVASFVGKGVATLMHRALDVGRRAHSAAEHTQALAVFKRHYAQLNGKAATLYPGVREMLDLLRAQGIPAAIVTNKALEFTLPLLEQFGLVKDFACILGSDSLPQKKPEPEPLLHACTQLGVAPATALMVGDSENDAVAARKAGVPVVLLRTGYGDGLPVDSLDCDGVISSLLELPAILGLGATDHPS